MACRYYVGTSGFTYKHWREVFYPKGVPQTRWLEHYAQHFSTVELNATFYRLPTEKTFEGWRSRTPEGFVFAVKASRTITHLKRLRDVEEPLQTLLSRGRLLKEKLGPVLYQLPPGMDRDEPLLESFLALLPPELSHVLEFRNPDWYQDSVYSLMQKHNVALCVHDMRQSEAPLVVTASFSYFRFHGPSGWYYGDYGHDQMMGYCHSQTWLGDMELNKRRVIGHSLRETHHLGEAHYGPAQPILPQP